MRPEVRAAWVAALRSHEFAQGEGQLVTTNERGEPLGYCCLGVLCALAVRAQVPIVVALEPASVSVPVDGLTFDGCVNYLPDSVMSWAGLGSDDPVVEDPDDPDELVRLSDLNDGGASFEAIAAAIEGSL